METPSPSITAEFNSGLFVVESVFAIQRPALDQFNVIAERRTAQLMQLPAILGREDPRRAEVLNAISGDMETYANTCNATFAQFLSGIEQLEKYGPQLGKTFDTTLPQEISDAQAVSKSLDGMNAGSEKIAADLASLSQRIQLLGSADVRLITSAQKMKVCLETNIGLIARFRSASARAISGIGANLPQ